METKAININCIPFIGKAKAGNFEPVTLYFDLQQIHDGKSVDSLGFSGFTGASDVSGNRLKPIEFPGSGFKYEFSGLNLRSSSIYYATLKPVKPEGAGVVAVKAKKSGAGISVNEGWRPGIYIFWMKLEMGSSDIRPYWREGSILFQFEIGV
jgi:hypothetical protein